MLPIVGTEPTRVSCSHEMRDKTKSGLKGLSAVCRMVLRTTLKLYHGS